MDAAAITALLTAVAGGAAGEAGRHVWDSLVSLVRRGEPGEDVQVDPRDGEAVRALSARVAERAALDPRFRQALEAWAAQHAVPRVSNTVSGDARIQGSVIQAGEIKGDINLG